MNASHPKPASDNLATGIDATRTGSSHHCDPKATPSPTGEAGASNLSTGMMGRIERAAAKGPQWDECTTCNGTGDVHDEPGFIEICQECQGAGGYMTDPKLALERMRKAFPALREDFDKLAALNRDFDKLMAAMERDFGGRGE